MNNQFKVFWKGIPELRVRNLYGSVLSLLSYWPTPGLIILHVGSDDLGRVSTHFLINDLKLAILNIKKIFPVSRVAFSEIFPRLEWSHASLKFIDKIRIRVNRNLVKFAKENDCLCYRHNELEGFLPGLYDLNNLPLSNIGLDILNVGFQNLIDSAYGVF